MNYYCIESKVLGGLGRDTKLDGSTFPPKVRKWMNDPQN
jgi:hypothetical protein